ncbi:MAG: hypothetical protein GX811_11700, partial [Lentisphaerae bacterium]|nr:hypothetical protein [Lentisphaerota bacterium]
ILTDTLPTDIGQVNRVIGATWWAAGGKAITTPGNLYRYTVRVAATEGQFNCGVNWSCGPYVDNSWEDGLRELMFGLGNELRARKESIFDTIPGISYPTSNGSVFSETDFFVSTESKDGKRVYLHFLRRPDNDKFLLPAANDRKRFASAKLLTGQKIPLTGKDNAFELDFAGCEWDVIDTVVVLEVER